MFSQSKPTCVSKGRPRLCSLSVYISVLAWRGVKREQGFHTHIHTFILLDPKLYVHTWCAHQLQGVQAVGAAGSGTWPQSADAGAFWTGGGSTDKAAAQVRDLQARVAALEEENAELQADATRHEAQLSVLKEELRAVDRAEKRAETSANAQVRSVFRRKFSFICWRLFQAY